tara:strand:+ start:2771 stop:3214 length:444 start_codon:yes stop_codon:yes gene_type:complete
MAIVGYNKIKQHIEIVKNLSGKINISNNVSIKDVEEVKLNMAKDKKDALRFIFEFNTNYAEENKEPNAFISIKGDVIFHEDSKKLKAYFTQWKKEKKMPKEAMEEVLNLVLTRSNIDALSLSQEFNLPPPVPLPKINTEKTSQNYIG